MTVWLGDLKNENGSSGYYPTDELTSRLARFVVDRMTGTAALERLSDIVGHHHARAFFLVRCKTPNLAFWHALTSSQTFSPSEISTGTPEGGHFGLCVVPDFEGGLDIRTSRTGAGEQTTEY